MSKKQTLLESFLEKGEGPNDQTTEDSKTTNKKKAAFKRKYQTSGIGGIGRYTVPHTTERRTTTILKQKTTRTDKKLNCMEV